MLVLILFKYSFKFRLYLIEPKIIRESLYEQISRKQMLVYLNDFLWVIAFIN